MGWCLSTATAAACTRPCSATGATHTHTHTHTHTDACMHACMHAHARTSTHTRVRARTSRHVLRQVQHSRARARAHTHTRTHTRTRTRTGIYTHNARTRAQDAMRQQGQFIRKPDGIPDKNFVGLDCLRTFNTHPHSQHRAAKFRLAGGATGARRAPAPQQQLSAR